MSSENDEQKKRDIRIAEYFLKQANLRGAVAPNESPDIDYFVDGRVIGIELTELAPPDGKTRLPGLQRVLSRCEEIHQERQFPNARCFVDFSSTLRVKKTQADAFADILIAALEMSIQSFAKNNEELVVDNGLPLGVLSVSIRRPLNSVEPTRYIVPYVVDHEVLRIADVKQRVSHKEQKLTGYRPGLHEYWLIIHFGHLPAEKWFIGPTPDLHVDFPIQSTYDRVYLLTPQIEGGVWLIT